MQIVFIRRVVLARFFFGGNKRLMHWLRNCWSSRYDMIESFRKNKERKQKKVYLCDSASSLPRPLATYRFLSFRDEKQRQQPSIDKGRPTSPPLFFSPVFLKGLKAAIVCLSPLYGLVSAWRDVIARWRETFPVDQPIRGVYRRYIEQQPIVIQSKRKIGSLKFNLQVGAVSMLIKWWTKEKGTAGFLILHAVVCRRKPENERRTSVFDGWRVVTRHSGLDNNTAPTFCLPVDWIAASQSSGERLVVRRCLYRGVIVRLSSLLWWCIGAGKNMFREERARI